MKKTVFLLALAFTLTPFASAPIALALGLVLALVGFTAWDHKSRRASRLLIQISIVLLGFSISFTKVAHAGGSGFLFALGAIICTFSLGWLIGRILHTEPNVTTLLCTGTAVCGGSAIAATAAIIRATAAQMSAALAAVFILNAVAIYLFPALRSPLGLSPTQYGTWCAIALHDMSSVVAAAKQGGDQALETATIIKLCRVLCLVPVSIFAAWLVSHINPPAATAQQPDQPRVKGVGRITELVPWFIALFLVTSAIGTFVPALSAHEFDLSWAGEAIHTPAALFKTLAKQGMVVALFLIGAGLSRSAIMSVGWRPFALAITLWAIISTAALLVVRTLVV